MHHHLQKQVTQFLTEALSFPCTGQNIDSGDNFSCLLHTGCLEGFVCLSAVPGASFRCPQPCHRILQFFQVLFQKIFQRLAAVIFHGFIGSSEQALQAVRAGYYLSFGHRTFASPKSVEALRQIPQNRLFVETDDYDISIGDVYERVAELLGVETESLEAVIEKNFETIFGAK